MAAGKSSGIVLSQEGLLKKICRSRNLRASACKGGKTCWYESVALMMPQTYFRASMSSISTRPRLCSADKSSAVSPTSTTRNAVLCSGVATPPQRVRGNPSETQAETPVGRQKALFAGAHGRDGQGTGGNGGNRRGTRTKGGCGGGLGGRGTQGASASIQGQTFNGSNGVFFSQSRPQTKCHRCNQSGHRHNECTATIALNPNPSAGSTFGQGNTAMVALPPPPSSSAGPSASTSAMVTTYSSSPSGGQQHPQKFMACLP